MKINSLFFIVPCILILFSACINSKKDSYNGELVKTNRHILTWKNWNAGKPDFEKVIFFIDGRKTGIGKIGFEKVIEKIKNFNNGGSLIIYGTLELPSSCASIIRCYPFGAIPELNKKFINVLDSKNISLTTEINPKYSQ